MTAIRCGRLDAHQSHTVTLPLGNRPGRTKYRCAGTPVTEGGHPCLECSEPRARCVCEDVRGRERDEEWWSA